MRLVVCSLLAVCLTSLASAEEKGATRVIDLKRENVSRMKPSEFTADTRFKKNGKEYTFAELRARQEKFVGEAEALANRVREESGSRLLARQQLYATKKRIMPLFERPRAPAASPAPVGAEPVISALSAKKISPGDYVIISGSGFGDRKGSVNAVIADRVVTLAITDWGPTAVYAQLRDDIQGLFATEALLKVKTTAGATGTPAQFHFEPATEVVLLDQHGWGERQVKKGGTAYVTCVDYDQGSGGLHYGAPVYGCSGTDHFFMHTRFKNGWVVEKIDLHRIVSEEGEADCKVSAGREGADSPEVSVSWWNSAMDACGYQLEVYARGPRGTSYR